MLKKLVNGEYSLKITFWLFGVMGMFIFNILTNITHNSALHLVCKQNAYCPRSILLYTIKNMVTVFLNGDRFLTSVGIHILLSVIFGVYAYLLLQGLWKSSKSYQGSIFWSLCAKCVLIIWIIFSLKSII